MMNKTKRMPKTRMRTPGDVATDQVSLMFVETGCKGNFSLMKLSTSALDLTMMAIARDGFDSSLYI